jgi:hypothetical protein
MRYIVIIWGFALTPAKAMITRLALNGSAAERQAVGRTSARGDTVEERPVNAPDFLATVCRALAIDATRQYTTRDGRPINLVERGATPVRELFA